MKKAFLLSMDAIIAVGLLFLLAAFLASLSGSFSSPELEYQRLYYTGKDAMNILETAKFSAVSDLMPVNFTADCNITEADMNKTILDVLGYLWARNSTVLNECAENLTRETLNLTLPSGFGYEILIDGVSIYSEGLPGSHVSRLNSIVSGYELGKPVSGYFASAYISRMSRSTSSYVYFGGYEGDGNITKILRLPEDANVTRAYMEANVGDNFTLYINGNGIGPLYTTPQNFTAGNWTLCSDFASCDAYFDPGNNTLKPSPLHTLKRPARQQLRRRRLHKGNVQHEQARHNGHIQRLQRDAPRQLLVPRDKRGDKHLFRADDTGAAPRHVALRPLQQQHPGQ